jgi:hypothetical protein
LNNTKKVELNPISSSRLHASQEWKPQACIMCVRERERGKKREMTWKTYHNDVCRLDWMLQERFQMCTINFISQTSPWPNHRPSLPLSSSPWPNCSLSLRVVEIFMLLKHEGTRRRWSSTPIISILRPLPTLPPCLLVSIDLCPTLCPLFVLPFQHH